MSGISINWRSPGPVAEAFLKAWPRNPAEAAIFAIMGPQGAAKTSTALLKMIYLVSRQEPSPRDGIRRIRVCVVRTDYRRLWSTTLKTWWKWVPKETGEWIGGAGGPATHTFPLDTPNGRAELTIDFIAIGDLRAEDVLRGYEPTWFYLNEADLLAYEVFIYAIGRAGRYPSMDDGGPTAYGVFMDFNAPEFETWIHNKILNDWTEGIEFFRQPPAMIDRGDGKLILNPDAENLDNLPPGYYPGQVKENPDWWVRRMILNEFGYNREGLPVFPEFNDSIHVSRRDLEPAEDLRLLIGADAGLNPAAILRQRTPNGQWRALDELVPGPGVGAKRFAAGLNQLLKERYPGIWKPDYIKGYADPSSAWGADKKGGERAWIDIVTAETGIRFRPAPTNDIMPRLESVRQTFTRNLDGHIPGNLISPRCVLLRKAYSGGYHYRRDQLHPDMDPKFVPVKNQSSHPADADQYVIMSGGEYYDVLGRKKARNAILKQTHAITDDNPRGGWRGRPSHAIMDD